MRVLVVATDHPPHRLGGYELQCAAAVEHLRRHGHEAQVLTSSRPGAGGPAQVGVHRDLVRFAPVPRPVSPWSARRAERRNAAALDRRLRAFAPDVVSWWRLGELSVSLLGRVHARGIPSVATVCDPWPLEAPERDPWARLRHRTVDVRAVDRWLVVSDALREQLAAGGVVLPGARVVPAGIDLPALGLAARRPWRWRLLYAGRLSALKGVDVAIVALAHLPDAATLDVVGDGEPAYRRELEALAARLGVAGRVRFRGARPPGAVAAAYGAADAVLFPTRWAEPWGLVPLEAMARGTPVVATGTGGSASYLRDGVNALLVAPDAPGAVAAAVRRLAAAPELRDRLRGAGRRTAEGHPAERASAAVRAALEAVAAQPLPATEARRATSRST